MGCVPDTCNKKRNYTFSHSKKTLPTWTKKGAVKNSAPSELRGLTLVGKLLI
jgi:hypothetical protein